MFRRRKQMIIPRYHGGLIHSYAAGTQVAGKMPLTQEKRLDSNFSNNNDQSYLHKKFKKASTVLPVKVEESRQLETSLAQIGCNTSIPNGSIASTDPEINVIRENHTIQNTGLENNVQTNDRDDNSRLSDVSNFVQATGKTSFADEFLNKTENLENDFIKEAYNSGGTGRYVCPYCKLSCAKPSVLQKHIRAHTNERPYPCKPCGFAFKTKSNLYKHRRSRTHALRLQGADISSVVNEEDLSGGSESDTSTPPIIQTETSLETAVPRQEYSRPNDFSSPELNSDHNNSFVNSLSNYNDNPKSKGIYKPKFRATLYQGNEEKERIKKSISHNPDFLTEHISKIISDNEAIVDVIETPLQKKYGKIKQIAESKQLLNEMENKSEATPLNLTKTSAEKEYVCRKRSHSETFAHIINEEQKHPLNPEGSIIKDLLLKTKANGLSSSNNEVLVEGLGPLYVCPLCQIVYRSAENLEAHKLNYCKGYAGATNFQNEPRPHRPENVFVRSNSINVKMPETHISRTSSMSKSPPLRNKPDNLVILKTECNDVIAPLPSPGPLLGNTRLVDTRIPGEMNRKCDAIKIKSKDCSPKRRLESRSETFSPRALDNMSPRSADLYSQSKLRCLDSSPVSLRSLEEMSQHMRHNSTSLQMFGGEVKIVDHLGSTTTLRIEPSKSQLSPIIIQQNLSPSKYANDPEASSIVVRSGLHSGGTIVHNPPTPKETSTPQVQTPRSTPNMHSANFLSIHDFSHFQFPPLSAITAYNPLTLPPLSPTSSPNGTSTILHGGKLIPHVPGIPGPNTSSLFVPSPSGTKNETFKSVTKQISEASRDMLSPSTIPGRGSSESYERGRKSKSPNVRVVDSEKFTQNKLNSEVKHVSTIPLIKIKNVDEPSISSISPNNNSKTVITKPDAALKRNADGLLRSAVVKENNSYQVNKFRNKELNLSSTRTVTELKSENDIKNFNFENLITKAEIYNNQMQTSGEVQKHHNANETSVSSPQNERSETSYFQKNVVTKTSTEDRKPKFLRPSTLPLKPGTFTPKRHHGITPNANTMPLVSPETPRPAKAYGQLYLNGNAYTYLGLKCSTKVFYCTINRPQPTYVPNQHFLSMYSNWQLLSDLTPDPLGLSASSAMSLYDSRHRPQNVAMSVIKQDLILTHSSQWKATKDLKQTVHTLDAKSDDPKNMSDNNLPKKELAGGFESNEEYTYVRGRGRGRYVCSECGIRCKKPSMLKKHIRTHTDVRPYTCIHCVFSFKTKGNLTKHMKSKAHYKKCCELGINPNEGNDGENMEMAQCSGETDDETDSDGDEGNEGETESSDTEIYKSRLPEHEAAHCLLSLGGNRPATSATPGLITSARPTTYPYTPIVMTDSVITETPLDNSQSLRPNAIDARIDPDNEPMDLSKSDVKVSSNMSEIPTARESSVLASLASNTAKLPQQQSQWANGEPMLHTYLTERALLDTKIKQSQLTSNLNKLRKIELESSNYEENKSKETVLNSVSISKPAIENIKSKPIVPVESIKSNESLQISTSIVSETKRARTPNNPNAENAKHVVSEYLKQARINHMKTHEDSLSNHHIDMSSDESNCGKPYLEDKKLEDGVDCNITKPASSEYDSVASKVVIGMGGVAFKVKGKDFEGTSYSPGKLMEDGRKVCDFCNKTFTKPSQLRLHLNIHYMERPFRCSVCAVSFRTRGHLQKHERSGSHHNKVSMTSAFGAATTFNPRPFRCSDCNIAFRIHGHLAKHLRSKMHVMRLECLFKLPFGTFTEIERAGLSLTDIDTTDCASSLASLQSLAQKLHEKDPSKLEYREPSALMTSGRESSEDEEASVGAMSSEKGDNVRDSDMKTIGGSEIQETETRVIYSATDN
ncbi:uncharacterized protein LOC121730122 isoform X2 [Aricia agestis]|uniref:uncharacterized protein LOC121730122 isoform X2 n=1 Tax=Aricia agestis TaxID=91739 RepID=UPI001C20AB99|nr:uncharacterized protein LOC121730122 isoform X2 [Aricia agestis]